MSTPRFLSLPQGVAPAELPLSHGPVAALRALPTSGSSPELCPAVLVHGFTGSKEDFIALLQSLAQVGREVVAIDLPGTYRSPGFENLSCTPGTPRPDYRLPSLGMVVAEVCESVGAGRPVHLVGHSMGGLIARETVLSQSTELHSLTLLCSGPAALTGQAAARVRMLIAALSAVDPTPERMRELWEEHMADDVEARIADPEVRAFLRSRLLESSPESLLRMAEDLLSAPDRTEELAAAGVASLVLFGEDDNGWTPKEQEEMADRLKARRIVVPAAGHSPNVEAPETTSSALTGFWNDCESVGRR